MHNIGFVETTFEIFRLWTVSSYSYIKRLPPVSSCSPDALNVFKTAKFSSSSIDLCQQTYNAPYWVCRDYYPTLGCDIPGFWAMGLSVQYWPRWFQDIPAIWLAVPLRTNGAHLGICTLPGKIAFVCEISCFWLKWSFPKGEHALWSLYGDKLPICRNQQMNGKI